MSKKNEFVHFRISLAVNTKLRVLSATSGVPVTQIVSEAIVEHLAKFDDSELVLDIGNETDTFVIMRKVISYLKNRGLEKRAADMKDELYQPECLSREDAIAIINSYVALRQNGKECCI